jgi:hypothetical protein
MRFADDIGSGAEISNDDGVCALVSHLSSSRKACIHTVLVEASSHRSKRSALLHDMFRIYGEVPRKLPMLVLSSKAAMRNARN